MFVACGIWCLADVSSVSPSSEQTERLRRSRQTDRQRQRDRETERQRDRDKDRDKERQRKERESSIVKYVELGQLLVNETLTFIQYRHLNHLLSLSSDNATISFACAENVSLNMYKMLGCF